MKFIKGTFFIQNGKYRTGEPYRFVRVEGWISTDYVYGFFKPINPMTQKVKNVWRATDLISGMYVWEAKTRRECVEFIESHPDEIAHAKTEQEFYDARARMVEQLRASTEAIDKKILKNYEGDQNA